MSEQLELEIEEEQIKLPDIGKIKVKIPTIKAKENNIDFTQLVEAVQQSFPFMDVQ